MDIIDVMNKHKDFAVGPDSASEVGMEWVEQGFGPEQADEWIGKARCFEAYCAATLEECGCTPEQASRILPPDFGSGCYSDTLGYKLSNGDLTSSEALDAVLHMRSTS